MQNEPNAAIETGWGKRQAMINLKIGGMLLIAGAVLFLLSDSLFGDSEAASYSALLGLIMFPVGLILTLVGLIQALTARVKNQTK